MILGWSEARNEQSSQPPTSIAPGTILNLKYSTKYAGRNLRVRCMEETLCNVEFLKGPKGYIARVQSDLGGLREYRSESFEEVLEQVIIDVQEEFESS